MLIQVGAMKKYALESLNGRLGKIRDFYVKDSTWNVRHLERRRSQFK